MTASAGMVVPLRVRGRIWPVRLERSGSTVIASCEIPTSMGPVIVSAACDQRAIRGALRALARSSIARDVRRVVAVGGDIDITGDFFEDIGNFFTKEIPRAVKKVTRSKVFRDVAQGIGAVTDHPAFNVAMAAVNVIPGYGQAISAGMAGLKVATGGMRLLSRAKAGEKKARGAIRTIARQAKAGDPAAARGMAVMRALNNAPQLQKGQPVPNLGNILAGLGATPAPAAANVPPPVLAQRTAEGLMGLMPGFARSDEYEQMKGLYQTGKGVADALGGFADLFGDTIDMEVGADGSYVPRRRPAYNLPPPRARA